MDIRVDELTKHFGTQTAVDHVSFMVRTGEVLGFLGPNGAGKTTTLRMLLGLVTPDAGSVTIGGQDVATADIALRRSIGYLPEANPLHDEMPVLDLLRFAARIQSVPNALIDERLRTMVEACGLEREKHKRVGELSKGYRQRVGLAQALVHDPSVLVLDEPTSGLDPNQIVEIRTLIKQLGRERTVIFSTHILAEVEATCDRVVIIGNGRIIADGTPATLAHRARGRQVLHVRVEGAGADHVIALLGTLPGVSQVCALEHADAWYGLEAEAPREAARSIFKAVVDSGLMLTGLQEKDMRLEDVFRELTLH